MKSIRTPEGWFAREGSLVNESVMGPCRHCGICIGFHEHAWRSYCKECHCARDVHTMETEHGARTRLGLVPVSVPDEVRSMDYVWVPVGLDNKQVLQFFACLDEDDIPQANTAGEQRRKQRLVTQLPKQDLATSGCKYIQDDQISIYKDFIKSRNEIALDIGVAQIVGTKSSCKGCDKSINTKHFAVSATRVPQCLWHPQCFRCTTCKDLLVDLTYCEYQDQIYCIRHYSEKMKPRCYACDELIFSAEYTITIEKYWHCQHFTCWQCDESLTGKRYVFRDEFPYCVKCYEPLFANTCEKCGRIIGIDSKDLSYKEKHWHEACFQCTTCSQSLADKQYRANEEKIYCDDCYEIQFAPRCDDCGDIFPDGSKMIKYNNTQWHEQCFKCCKCETPIGPKNFIWRDSNIYCAGCYEEKIATRCIMCNKAIQRGGVIYKNDPLHRECFTCAHCDKNLANQLFHSREDKPCCNECFGRLFAKRCTSCKEPISDVGGTCFNSFGDRHWHNDCFICADCSTSLIGRGFITDQDNIICPECAKKRVM